MKFHLILTLDYEVFGNGTGCIEKCLVDPTDRCQSIVESYNARLNLFVESLELLIFEEYQTQLTKDHYAKIHHQLQHLLEKGHSLHLHMHPQWLDAYPLDDHWHLSMDKWRIGDLGNDDLQRCVMRGLSYLSSCRDQIETENMVFRAGGWTIQPGESALQILKQHGIRVDSTVAPGLFNPSRGDWYDFRETPDLPYWKISQDVCVEDPGGVLLEIPIATHNIGVKSHTRILVESRSNAPFPEGCVGDYGGPNGKLQLLRGRLAKIRNMGTVMLDFSSLPAWALIEVTEKYMERFDQIDGTVPIVAIGHNKNFGQSAEQNLGEYLAWVQSQTDIIFSDYRHWMAS